jgi:hypothetical protein
MKDGRAPCGRQRASPGMAAVIVHKDYCKQSARRQVSGAATHCDVDGARVQPVALSDLGDPVHQHSAILRTTWASRWADERVPDRADGMPHGMTHRGRSALGTHTTPHPPSGIGLSSRTAAPLPPPRASCRTGALPGTQSPHPRSAAARRHGRKRAYAVSTRPTAAASARRLKPIDAQVGHATRNGARFTHHKPEGAHSALRRGSAIGQRRGRGVDVLIAQNKL